MKGPITEEQEVYFLCGINIYKALSGQLRFAAGSKDDLFLAGLSLIELGKPAEGGIHLHL